MGAGEPDHTNGVSPGPRRDRADRVGHADRDADGSARRRARHRERARASWEVVRARLPGSEATRREIRRIEVRDIGAINREQERLRLALRRLELRGVRGGPEVAASRRSWPRCSSATMSRRRASRAPDAPLGEPRGGGRSGQGQGAAPRAGDRGDLSQPHGPCGKAADYAAGLWRFVWEDPREANTEGGVLPRHLRHRADGHDHERHRDAARRARRLLPARVRAARRLRQRGADRRQQPRRSAVDRVRRLRGGLLHLLRRRRHRPAVLLGGPAHADVRDGRHPVGLAHAGAADGARRHRGHRGRGWRRSPAGCARHRWPCRRDQARDHPAGRAARGDAVGAHGAHPGHGASGGRGGARS